MIIATPNDFGRAEGILVHNNVTQLSDLKGKKIGVTYASSAHVLLLDVLESAGISPNKDLNIINLPATELLTAYRSGQIDAAAAWTPTFNRILALPDTKMLLDDRAFSLYKNYKMSPGPDVLLTRVGFGKSNPEAVSGFMTAIFEANDFMEKNPEETAKMLVELTSLTLDEQIETIKQTTWYNRADQQKLLVQPGEFVIGLEKLSDMLLNLKQIDKVPKVREWVNTSYIGG
jgi:taurine transport system substrate-binding protein